MVLPRPDDVETIRDTVCNSRTEGRWSVQKDQEMCRRRHCEMSHPCPASQRRIMGGPQRLTSPTLGPRSSPDRRTRRR